MLLRTIVFTSLLFAGNPSDAMHIIKKNKHKKEELKQNHFNPIIKDLLFAQKIGQQNNLPKEISAQIIQYNILLKNKQFEQTFPYIDVWQDFRIPVVYHQLLTPTQINIIHNLFTYEPSKIPYPNRFVMHYSLDSKKDYKEFLTLPIELRRHSTKLPQSATDKLTLESRPNSDDNINRDKIIRVGRCADEIKAKLIIPEEKIKHTKLDVNQ